MLDLFLDKAVEPKEAPAVAISESTFRQRILVAEDDADLRRLNADVLTCSGYHVDAVADGADAWESLQGESYDLLITDNNMPRMSGVELLQKLHTSGTGIPVIMATSPVPALKYPLPDFSKFLVKPYTPDELLNTVKRVLHASAVIHGRTPPPNWSGV